MMRTRKVVGVGMSPHNATASIRAQLHLRYPVGRWITTKEGTASTQPNDASEATDKPVRAGAKEANGRNPWSHFQAFSGMDEYMDVTLIQYRNEEPTSEKKKEAGDSTAHSDGKRDAK